MYKNSQVNVITKWILVIVILLVCIMVFMKLFRGGVWGFESQVCSVDHDEDNDGVNDFMDKCPCNADKETDCMDTKKCNDLIEASCKKEKKD